MIYCGNRLY